MTTNRWNNNVSNLHMFLGWKLRKQVFSDAKSRGTAGQVEGGRMTLGQGFR